MAGGSDGGAGDGGSWLLAVMVVLVVEDHGWWQ